MEIYFLRHGEAEDYSADDHSRNLTARGIARIQTAAQVIHKLNLGLNHIYTSPRNRAHQTAQIVAEVLGMPIEITEYLNFGFNMVALERLIAPFPDDARVMVVGHEPTFSQTIASLTGAQADVKRGGLARVAVPKTRLKMGVLVWLIAPKVFDVLGK